MRQPVSSNEVLQLHFLVLRCQVGDETAFARLYGTFGDRTHRYLKGLLGVTDADDVQQEVWLTVYRKIADLVNPSGFRTWLYQITRNRALDQLRRTKRKSEFLTGIEETTPEAFPAVFEETLPSPDHSELDAAMARLSPVHRDVLFLLYWEEMSYQEIALVAGCSIGTIRSRIHHAKLYMKALIESEKGPTPTTTNPER